MFLLVILKVDEKVERPTEETQTSAQGLSGLRDIEPSEALPGALPLDTPKQKGR